MSFSICIYSCTSCERKNNTLTMSKATCKAKNQKILGQSVLKKERRMWTISHLISNICFDVFVFKLDAALIVYIYTREFFDEVDVG